jgi:hypothetical protein
MTMLAFGQPAGAIVQYAYVVDDIERSIMAYVDRLGIGPWSLRERFQPPRGRYRGQPTSPTFSLARAFSGHVMIELIEQHDALPSVYHEGPGPRAYGFHHWAIMTTAFDADVARYAALGYEEAFADLLPSGARIVYLDSRRDLPGMLELVEHNEAQERFYTAIYELSQNWDGNDPIRREG